MASRESSESDREEEELHLSASSSSFEGNSSYEDEEQPELLEEPVPGVVPYQFEPLVEDADIDEAQQVGLVAQQEREGQVQRRNNLDWCLCGECSVMPAEQECLCCREVPHVCNRTDEVVGIQCITHHEGFQPVCLNVHVLLVAYMQYRQQFGERAGHQINEQYRYTAYRQFVRWCWGYLGRHVRVVLPSCVVGRIRDAFPAAEYAGFQYPNIN